MLKVEALEKVKGCPVKTAIIEEWWRRWATLDDLGECTRGTYDAVNVTLHLKQLRTEGITVSIKFAGVHRHATSHRVTFYRIHGG